MTLMLNSYTKLVLSEVHYSFKMIQFLVYNQLTRRSLKLLKLSGDYMHPVY